MSDYLLGHHDSVLRSHRWRTAENSAGYLLSHLRAGTRVLDVGCGPGTITADFADIVGPQGAVLGIDASAEVVAQARREVPASADRRVAFAVGDVTALDLPDDAFDVAHAHQVLQHLQDPVGALRELRRVTRPGGLVAVRDADYAAMTWHPSPGALETWRSLYRRVAHDLGAEPDAGRRLLGWALAAGFTDVTPSATAWCFATPEDRAWWGGLQADRIQESEVAERAIATGLADRAALADIADGWRRWATSPNGWFAILHGELLCRVDG